jgi:two-component system, NtrC family, sensor kinase
MSNMQPGIPDIEAVFGSPLLSEPPLARPEVATVSAPAPEPSASPEQSEIKQLQKQLRIVEMKLKRSEYERHNLESSVQRKEALLKRVINQLQGYQTILETKRRDLELAFNELTLMQDKLVEADKMAALGGLVAGVAHEINTPVGNSITVASTLMEATKSLEQAISEGQIKRSTLTSYLNTALESTQLLVSNLNRAGELVQSFKQVSVDQSNTGLRQFEVKHYLEDVVLSLSPQFKKTAQTISVEGDDSLSIHSYPGILAQIATNFITNSLAHAYQPDQAGHIRFLIAAENNRVVIRYRDDGCGIPSDHIERVFEPFFTTARHQGGTGLGLHITYNLVTQKLEGEIELESQVGQGTEFTLRLPFAVSAAAPDP